MENQTVQPHADEHAQQSSDEMVVVNHEVRLSRLLDYQASSLAKEDPLEANLGSINSGLMRVALWLDEAIEQSIRSGPGTMERVQKMLPAIETHLRVTRQVDRFAQIEVRAAESRKPKASNDSSSTLCLEASPVTDVSQSEDSEV